MTGLQDLHLLKNLQLMMMMMKVNRDEIERDGLNKRKTAIMMDDMKCRFDIDSKRREASTQVSEIECMKRQFDDCGKTCD